MDTNLYGDNIPQKPPKRNGISKVIYFAKINVPDYVQNGLEENQVVNLRTILNKAFCDRNDNFHNDSDGSWYSVKLDGGEYCISIIDHSNDYYFGRISTEKEHNDVLEEYRSADVNNNRLNSVIIKYFTFFYIDINSRSLVYIGQKGLKSINKLLAHYCKEHAKIDNIHIDFLADKKLIQKVENCNKLTSIQFQVSDNLDVISKTLDQVLSWTREIDIYEVRVKIKRPSKKMVKQILTNRSSWVNKIKDPVLSFQDDQFNQYMSNLFEESFTIKGVISVDDITPNNFDSIKKQLIDAMDQYMR